MGVPLFGSERVRQIPANRRRGRIVPTLLELRDRGHEVHVRTLVSECAPLNKLGLHATPIVPEIEAIPLADFEVTSMEEALGLPWAQSIPLFQSFTPGPGAPPVLGLVPYCLAPEPGLEVLNRPRRELGLQPLTSPDQVWRAPLHLCYTAPPLEDPDLWLATSATAPAGQGGGR